MLCSWLVVCAHQVTAGGLVKFIEASPSLQQLDVLMPEAGPGGAAVHFETCFALAAQCPQLKVCHTLRGGRDILSRSYALPRLLLLVLFCEAKGKAWGLDPLLKPCAFLLLLLFMCIARRRRQQ